MSLLAACGGGGGGGSGSDTSTTNSNSSSSTSNTKQIPTNLWVAPTSAVPVSGNYVYLQSDAGDNIGQGKTYTYTNTDTLITPSATGLSIAVSLRGNQSWTGNFLLPNTLASLQKGYFDNLTRTVFADHAVGGLEWTGEGRGCFAVKGWLVVDKAELTGNELTALDLRFEQHCEGITSSLHGQIHWTKADSSTNQTSAPQIIPSNLWAAASSALPQSGNYIYLEGGAGDYIGGGKSYTYSESNANLSLSTSAAHLGVQVKGNQSWTGDFQGIQGMSQLAVGYYSGLMRYPFNNPVLGGLSWTGDGRGCNQSTGWFAVDKVSYSGSTLTAIDLRFEQYCDGDTTPLHGQIHWTQADASNAPAPVPQGIPNNLWKAATTAVPQSGNYLYLESNPGDYIGAGKTYTYTQSNAVFKLNNAQAHLGLQTQGDQNWSGDFQGIQGQTQLAVGYYSGLIRYPFNNPVLGGLSWYGDGRGCNTLTGWFVIDKVSYSGSTLTAIDLRFEQYCDGGAGALHGQFHWSATDTTVPSGPQTPLPVGLWQPPSSFTAPAGNYIYLVGDAGDYINGGNTSVLTSISVKALQTPGVQVSAGNWFGDFAGMNTLTQLQPGYYGNLLRYPFHNPVRGGLDWFGNGRGCNTLTGWFVVDNVSYVSGQLKAIDLRFEQHCEGANAALHGVIHWAQ